MEIIKIMELLKSMAVECAEKFSTILLNKNDEEFTVIEKFDFEIDDECNLILEDLRTMDKIKIKLIDIRRDVENLFFRINDDEYELTYC